MRTIKRAVQQHVVAICDPIEDEILRMLHEKFHWPSEDALYGFSALLPFPMRVQVTGQLHVCRDPDDDMILECAVNSGAEVIITGDKDLLSLGTFQNIRILTPAQFLEADNQPLR